MAAPPYRQEGKYLEGDLMGTSFTLGNPVEQRLFLGPGLPQPGALTTFTIPDMSADLWSKPQVGQALAVYPTALMPLLIQPGKFCSTTCGVND